MSIEVSGFFGVIWLIATIWAIVRTIQSNAGTAKKTIWIVLIILLPLFGLIAWFFLGPKG